VLKVVLDTNVLVSAVVYGGNPRKVLQAAISGAVDLSVSETIIKELQQVLQRPRFGLSVQFIQNTIAELTSIAEWVVPTKHHQLVDEDPSDNFVLDCAVAAEADYLVTGDDHLIRLKACGSVRIVNSQQFVEILEHG
jgi:putative PIN family toxin of toxin-antitoxin system